MDHMKEALKKKMGKVVTIKIQVDDDNEKNETDLAPDVEDSEEPGVKKADHADQGQDMEMMEQQLPGGDDYANALISQAPDHPAGGKTLESIAKERAMKRMGAKKG